MTIADKGQVVGPGNITVAHVFGGPVAVTNVSVSTTAGSTVLEEGKYYRFTCATKCYFLFGASGGSALTSTTGDDLLAEVPEVFRCPKGKTTLYHLGTATDTLKVAEMEI